MEVVLAVSLAVFLLLAVGVVFIFISATQSEKLTMWLQLIGYVAFIVSIFWVGLDSSLESVNNDNVRVDEIISQMKGIKLFLFIFSSILLMSKGIREVFIGIGIIKGK